MTFFSGGDLDSLAHMLIEVFSHFLQLREKYKIDFFVKYIKIFVIFCEIFGYNYALRKPSRFLFKFFLHIFKYYGKFKIYVGKVMNLSKYFSKNFEWICNRLKNMLLASLKLGIFTSLWKKIEMVFLGWNSAKMEFGVYILIWIWKIDILSYIKVTPM